MNTADSPPESTEPARPANRANLTLYTAKDAGRRKEGAVECAMAAGWGGCVDLVTGGVSYSPVEAVDYLNEQATDNSCHFEIVGGELALVALPEPAENPSLESTDSAGIRRGTVSQTATAQAPQLGQRNGIVEAQ